MAPAHAAKERTRAQKTSRAARSSAPAAAMLQIQARSGAESAGTVFAATRSTRPCGSPPTRRDIPSPAAPRADWGMVQSVAALPVAASSLVTRRQAPGGSCSVSGSTMSFASLSRSALPSSVV